MRLLTAAAQRTAPGEAVCGDGHLVVERADGLLAAVVDGLGHGPVAHRAAQAFVGAVTAEPGHPLDELLRRGARAMACTRGAAASLLAVSQERCTFAGIGNVKLLADTRVPFSAFPLPGVLGTSASVAVKLFEGRVSAGDTFVLVSDGIGARVQLPPRVRLLPPAAIAEQLIATAEGGRDDATVLVVRAEPPPAV